MSDILERPPRGESGRMLDYLADCIEAQSEELARFVRVAEDRMLTCEEVASRLRISMPTFRKWRRLFPWKLPNFGASAFGDGFDYRCSIADYYDWYHIRGVTNPDAYHLRQWDQMGAEARKETRGIAS